MLVKDFITKELPVLKSFDTGEYALALMDDFKLKHLPLLSENIYRCLVSEKDLLAMPDPNAAIGDPVLFSPSVREDTHIHEALALVTRYRLSLLPVVSAEGEYRGAITRDKLAEMKHGPIALVDQDMPIVFLATHHQLYEKIISNMQEVKSR